MSCVKNYPLEPEQLAAPGSVSTDMKSILPTLFLAAALMAPAAAAAETVAPDPDARQVTALGGTIVWVSGNQPAKLMMRSPDGAISPVPGTTERAAYRNPDLGRDAKNRLVLTYSRCSSLTKCTSVRDDLAGHATVFEGLAPKHCVVGGVPAVWKSSVAYALACFKRNAEGLKVSDEKRSGLYLKKGKREPVRFTAPYNARRTGSLSIDDVDLRGNQIAAVYEDVSAYAIVQSTTGSLRYSERVASSEGDGEQSAAGLTIGTGDARLWVLTRSSYAGDPAVSVLQRFGKGNCSDHQSLFAPAGSSDWDYPFIDLSVDDGTMYAVDAGVGVVKHVYAAMGPCS